MTAVLALLFAAALIIAVITFITPDCPAKKILRIVCAVSFFICAASALKLIGKAGISEYYSSYSQDASEIAQSGEENAKQKSKTIIEEKCREYILDKGESLGGDVSDAEIELYYDSEGFWYPFSVRIVCTNGGEWIKELSDDIIESLGVPRSRQSWRIGNG